MEINYVAPELEVLEVMVEQGFGGSGNSENDPSIEGGEGFPF